VTISTNATGNSLTWLVTVLGGKIVFGS
jgi:hypothetical protein